MKKKKIPKTEKPAKPLKVKNVFTYQTWKRRIMNGVLIGFLFLTLMSFIQLRSLQGTIKTLKSEALKSEQSNNLRADTASFTEQFLISYYYFNKQPEYPKQRQESLKRFTSLSIKDITTDMESVSVSQISLAQSKVIDATTDELTFTIRRTLTLTDKTTKSVNHFVSVLVSNNNGHMAIVDLPRYVSLNNFDASAKSKVPNSKTIGGTEVKEVEERDKLQKFTETYFKAYTANNTVETNLNVLKTMQIDGLKDTGVIATIDTVTVENITVQDNGDYKVIASVKFKEDVHVSEMVYVLDIQKNGQKLLVKNKL